jgi:fibrillarin-like pre-rRNA processing protein
MSVQRLQRHNGRSQTLNMVPGQRIYGERLNQIQGHEYREWTARRSKLAAYLDRGGRNFHVEGTEQVLYLGAASGTTVSHLSDLLPQGRIFAVEFSPRPYRDLLRVASQRPNLVPILSDAGRPEDYGAYLLHRVPILYQDIAQRDQARLFWENARRFLGQRGLGFLAIKARSIDVASPPRRIYESVRNDLAARGLEPIELVELEPYEKDHAMLVVRAKA